MLDLVCSVALGGKGFNLLFFWIEAC